MARCTYAEDRDFLAGRAKLVELTGPDDARALVAPAWQGRVMTSTLAGEAGLSGGWVNRPFIEAGRDDEGFNNYGGEDRFWLGPEAGQFGLWFAAGEPFDVGCARTPPGINRGGFDVTSQGASFAAMARQFEVTNYSGTQFRCAVRRTIEVLDYDRTAGVLGATVPRGVRSVAFESSNTLVNVGDEPWRRETGLLSVWTLGQFPALPRGEVVVPFLPGGAAGEGVQTDYFDPPPPDRCRVLDDHVRFACDGRCRGKIGVSPARSRGVLGSFDPDEAVLTVVQFNQPPAASKLPYVNSLWELQDDPYAGDAINSYNDGPQGEAGESFGAFYELETSSPAAELAPGESICHTHRTCHFAGDFDGLRRVAWRVFGVDLQDLGR